MDIKMWIIYSFVISIPSLGKLPLVLGRAFRYLQGPLESDPKCEDMLDYMIFHFLIFKIIYFFN